MDSIRIPKPSALRRWGVGLALAAVIIICRSLVWLALQQLFYGLMVALLALPVMRVLEKRLKPSLAASLAMTSLSASVILLIALILPALIEQGRQLAAMLPQLWSSLDNLLAQVEGWLGENGMTLQGLRESITQNLRGIASAVLPETLGYVSGAAETLGKVMLAPVFAFYMLRDRRAICGWLTLLVPITLRERALITLREMRRELGGFLRGQLLISACVGGLTAIGLLICGVPAWLLLGFFMGVMELIPYLGPFLGGAMVLFFALPGGVSRAMWALGVVILVQQLEGGMISPGLMSETTRLHPIVVVLCVVLGGVAGGVMGILLAVPIVLCIRAALKTLAFTCNNLQVLAQNDER